MCGRSTSPANPAGIVVSGSASLPGLGRQAVGDDAPVACGRRQAVHRLCRRRPAGGNRPVRRRTAHRADLRRGAGRIELHLRSGDLEAGPRRLDQRARRRLRGNRRCAGTAGAGQHAVIETCLYDPQTNRSYADVAAGASSPPSSPPRSPKTMPRPLAPSGARSLTSSVPSCPSLTASWTRPRPMCRAYMTFPPQHPTKLHSTNPIERLYGEIKRRTEVVGIFPNEDAIVRLIGAILLEQNDEWAVQRARYMTLEAIAPMIPPSAFRRLPADQPGSRRRTR
nr:transposase for insertion sequence element IS1081 [Bradyrhizobium sp. DOA9]